MKYGKRILFGEVHPYQVFDEDGGSTLKRLQPYVGICGKSPNAVLGIGFQIHINTKPDMFWGVQHEQYCLIQTWRAMQLLGRVRCIDDQGKALAASLSLFDRKRTPNTLDIEYVRELARHFNGMHYLSTAITEISQSLPEEDDLDTLIAYAREYHIPIDVDELKGELRLHGRTIDTAVIHALMLECETHRAKRKKTFWEIFVDALALHV